MSAPFEFRSVSGKVFLRGFLFADATVAHINAILNDRGYHIPAGSRYVYGTTSVAIEDHETPVCGGTWTVVPGSVDASPSKSIPDRWAL